MRAARRLLFLAPLLTAALAAQQSDPVATALRDTLRWRSIGPANMMGRIASVDALPDDHRRVLCASASGGVFLSDNAGITWQAIFDGPDREGVGPGSIGAAVFSAADPRVIWVGTGEASNRNSVGWGDGIYVSSDGGGSFRHCGLGDTRQIAEIATHPTDPDVAWVAAVGSLWGPSGSRGLYKTTDRGQSWQKLAGGLPEAPLCGCTEVLVHPEDPDTVYCAFYERLRQPWWMRSGGEQGGIYRSRDGGATWSKLTEGLPEGATGMIDLDVCRAQPDVLVACVEAEENIGRDLSAPGSGIYRSDDGGDSWRFLLHTTVRPFYHGQVAVDPGDPQRIYAVGREFSVSKDGGGSWDRKWWGGGGDDHDMWISAVDGAVRYMATDQGLYLTVDDGATVVGFDNMAIGQYYAIAVDHSHPYRVMGGLQDNGVWIGPSRTREPRGILNMHNSWVVEGDGFHCQIDPRDSRTSYAVIHVGFCARVDLLTREIAYITPTPETVRNYREFFDPEHPDPAIRYTIYPGEGWFYGRDPIRPKLPPQFRFNWSSPLVLSPHDPDVVYFAGNHLFESRDRGESWRIVSPDLTTDDPERRRPSESGGLTRSVTGGENFCTIVTVGPSPLDPQELWCGTDDGRIQVTRDGGASWTDVAPNLHELERCAAPGAWVSRVTPSAHVAGRCYVTLDDHRRDDFEPYVFVTDDHGASWRDVTGDLPPDGSVYVVREDQGNPELLFVGTEFGAFATLDGGSRWERVGRRMPQVAVYDLVIHPRDGDLVAGTHGRSVWVLDDITGLRQLTAEVRARDVALLKPRPATLWNRVRLGRKQPDFLFRGENPATVAAIQFWSKAGGDAEIMIYAPGGELVAEWGVSADPGLSRETWQLTADRGDGENEALRQQLLEAIEFLRTQPLDEEHSAALDTEAEYLQKRWGARRLGAARQRLVRGFGRFAAGRALFGEQPRLRRVEPGSYRVVLKHAGVESTTQLLVRADPQSGGSAGR